MNKKHNYHRETTTVEISLKSCTVSEILSDISQNLQRSRDHEHIHLGGNVSRMHSLHTNQELVSLIPKILLGSKNHNHGPFRSGLSSYLI